MKKIKIDKMRDILIAEKVEGGTLKVGSQIFCGCCGGSIGEMKKDLKSPFTAKTFLAALKNRSVEWTFIGLSHTCRHIMFPFKKAFNFIPLDIYQKTAAKNHVNEH